MTSGSIILGGSSGSSPILEGDGGIISGSASHWGLLTGALPFGGRSGCGAILLCRSESHYGIGIHGGIVTIGRIPDGWCFVLCGSLSSVYPQRKRCGSGPMEWHTTCGIWQAPVISQHYAVIVWLF